MKAQNIRSLRHGGSTIALLAALVALPSGAAFAAEAPSADGVQDIIVTAQKRAESLQDTPISVSAFNQDMMKARDTNNIGNLAGYTPNLEINTGKGDGGSTNAAIFIRGVGQNDFIFPTDPGVGVYVDGVYIARSIGAMMDLSDIERVEVLRGPQGTLYGKNTIGGAINIVSSRPGDDFSGQLGVTTGSRSRIDAEGKVNIPLIPGKLAIKLAGATKNQDGYVIRASDGIDLGDVGVDVGRFALAWNATDTFKVDLSVDGSRIRQNGAPQRLTDTFSAPGGLYDAYNALGAPYIAATDDSVPDDALFDDSWVSSNRHVSNATGPTRDKADVWGANLTLSWSRDDSFAIKSITGYREMDAKIQVDMDGTPFPVVHTDEVQSEDQFSEELQFSGKAADGRLNWLVGVYYFHENAYDENQTRLASGLYDALENAVPGPFVPLVPGMTCPPEEEEDICLGGEGNPYNEILDLDDRPITSLKTKNWAVFGQASYEVSPGLTLTAGGRYSWERKNYFIDAIFPNSGKIATPPTHDQRTWKNFTPKFGIDYKLNRDVLLYASFSKGFKSGGWNPRPLSPEEFKSYDPEKLTAYEAGIKTRLLDGRMTFNVAGFYSQYKDLQLQTNGISPTTGGLILTVDNAGSVDLYGFEVELMARPVRGLDLNAGIGYLHNEYQSLADNTGYPITNKLPKAPAWTISTGAQYAYELPDSLGVLTLRGDLNYRSKTYHDPANSPSIVQPGYALVDGRISWSSVDKSFELALFGKNLTDKFYFTAAEFVPSFGFQNMVVGRPREWGLSLTTRF